MNQAFGGIAYVM